MLHNRQAAQRSRVCLTVSKTSNWGQDQEKGKRVVGVGMSEKNQNKNYMQICL